jgi:hypothetical protein
MYMRASRGIRLQETVTTEASATALAQVPFDFDRYVATEPRLRSARWLVGTGPAVGSEAELVAEIPFTVPVARVVFGAPEAVVTITEWVPPAKASVRFRADRFHGWATITMEDLARGCLVAVEGEVLLRSRLAARLLRPFEARLERLASRAIARGVHRAAQSIV